MKDPKNPTGFYKDVAPWMIDDDEEEVKCNTCNHGINPYEEKVNVWNIFDEEHPSGHQIFLCTKCHRKRKYPNEEDN